MKKEKEFYTVRGYQMLSAENKLLTSSMEDYLEMILRLFDLNGYVRINHLAEKLNVKPSSASKVIKKLGELGLVDYQKYGIIKPSDEGKEIGQFLLKRHDIIETFLKNLGVKKMILKDTEMIEHDVGMSTLKNIHVLNEFFKNFPNIKKQYELFKEEHIEDIDSSIMG